jgi:1,4-dihydroxy-2-naphthoate polyprenyltransferase
MTKENSPKSLSEAWLQALRLRTLPLSLSGILLGSGMAYLLLEESFEIAQKNFYLIFLLAMLTTVAFQIVSNLANDLGDSEKGTDNENRVGPVRAVQSGWISTTQMRNAVVISAVISMCLAGSLIYVSASNLTSDTIVFYGILAIACVAAAITYTVGKNAYGYRGLGDVMVFLFFGGVSVLGMFSLFGFGFQFIPLLGAVTIGCWSTAVLNLNNLRDHENDAVSGKRTLVVKLGFETAKRYHIGLVIIGVLSWNFLLALLSVLTGKWWIMLAMLPGFVLLKHLVSVWREQIPAALDKELKVVALSTFFAALIFFLSCLI